MPTYQFIFDHCRILVERTTLYIDFPYRLQVSHEKKGLVSRDIQYFDQYRYYGHRMHFPFLPNIQRSAVASDSLPYLHSPPGPQPGIDVDGVRFHEPTIHRTIGIPASFDQRDTVHSSILLVPAVYKSSICLSTIWSLPTHPSSYNLLSTTKAVSKRQYQFQWHPSAPTSRSLPHCLQHLPLLLTFAIDSVRNSSRLNV